MKLRSLLLGITLFIVAASAAFAGVVTVDRIDRYNMDVTIDTSALVSGYIYFQYSQSGMAAPSTATIQGFTGGSLGLRGSDGEINPVIDNLPGDVVFDSTKGGDFSLEDYNQYTDFGDSITFHVLFNGGISSDPGSSTFFMGLYSDVIGQYPLLDDDDCESYQFSEDFANVPEPSFLLLLCPGLLGVFGLRKQFVK